MGRTLCKVISINDEEGDHHEKPNDSEEEDVTFLFKVLLEIRPKPGISLILDGNLVNADHLLLLKSDLVRWCDQCSTAIQQARKLYQQINKATDQFRKIQRNIVETLKKCVVDDDSMFDKDENYKAIWRKLCLHNEGRFNKFDYPFIVQNSVPRRPPPMVAVEEKDTQEDQTQLSSCHSDDIKNELVCKNEDVKNVDDADEEEVPRTKQQRILLIFPDDEGGRDGDDQDSDNDSLSSPSASDEDEETVEINTNSSELADADTEEDDPLLAADIKEEPDLLTTDNSQDNHKAKEKSLPNHCTVCNKSYSRKDHLTAHNKRYHSSNSNKFKPMLRKGGKPATPNFHCLDSECHKFYKTFTNLRAHMKKCHSQIPLPTQIKPSQFHIKYPELYSKIVRNPDTKLFTCPYSTADPPCLKASKWKGPLERHIKCKHLGESVYPWQCICLPPFFALSPA